MRKSELTREKQRLLWEGITMTNNKKNNGGRPAGRRKTAKIEISIEPSVKEEFMNLMRVQGKMASVEIGLWIREYLKCYKEVK